MVKRKSSMRTRKHATKRRVGRKTNRRKTKTRKRMRGGFEGGPVEHRNGIQL